VRFLATFLSFRWLAQVQLHQNLGSSDVQFEGRVVPVLGPVTLRSNVCLTAGQMAIEVSLKIADSRSLGQGCQHCEGVRCQGCFTTAHMSSLRVVPVNGLSLSCLLMVFDWTDLQGSGWAFGHTTWVFPPKVSLPGSQGG
jgi:hypothetical protein